MCSRTSGGTARPSPSRTGRPPWPQTAAFTFFVTLQSPRITPSPTTALTEQRRCVGPGDPVPKRAGVYSTTALSCREETLPCAAADTPRGHHTEVVVQRRRRGERPRGVTVWNLMDTDALTRNTHTGGRTLLAAKGAAGRGSSGVCGPQTHGCARQTATKTRFAPRRNYAQHRVTTCDGQNREEGDMYLKLNCLTARLV